jgi:hypothetical protein
VISLRRAAWYAAAPLFGLLLYWRAPLTWFQNDDFAWLSLPMDARANGISHALFAPFGQGKVRLLSERLLFLSFSEIFGLHTWPFRVLILATWIAALILILLIGERLTGSPATGLLAALFWAVNTNAVPSIVWISAYNEVACAVCLMGAFYSRLRGWRAAEWIFYLIGFGVLELILMYPFIAALHALLTDRKQLKSTVPLFVPSLAFVALTLFVIPRWESSLYALSVDSRILQTFATYLKWAMEPGSAALGAHAAVLAPVEIGTALLLGLGLIWFMVRRGGRVALFFCGWFVLMLAPLLPLANHATAYYLTLPMIGLAWLGGYAAASAWQAGAILRLAAVGLAALYMLGSAAGVNAQTRWFRERSTRMKMVVERVASAAAEHPGQPIALQGIDEELLAAGIQDRPFRLVGADHVSVNEPPAPGAVVVDLTRE